MTLGSVTAYSFLLFPICGIDEAMCSEEPLASTTKCRPLPLLSFELCFSSVVRFLIWPLSYKAQLSTKDRHFLKGIETKFKGCAVGLLWYIYCTPENILPQCKGLSCRFAKVPCHDVAWGSNLHNYTGCKWVVTFSFLLL